MTPRALRAFLPFAAWIVVALSGAALVLFSGLNNDTNTLLRYALHLWRDGGLYTRWLEINPPLILLLYVPPAALSHLTPVPASVALHGMALAACAGSLLLLRAELARHALQPAAVRFWVMLSAWALVVLPPAVSVFGDREHLLFVFALPWMLPMLLGFAPSRRATLIAAIGFCLKPYNAVAFAVLVLLGGPARALRERVSAPYVLPAVAVGAAYVLLVVLAFPGYMANVVPLGLLTYPVIGCPPSQYAQLVGPRCLLYLAILFLTPLDAATRVRWLAFALAMLVTVLLNGGWDYTQLLMTVPLALLCGLAWRTAPQAGHARGVLLRVLAGATLLYGGYEGLRGLRADVLSTRDNGYAHVFHHEPPDFYPRLRAAAGERFVLLSTTLWAASIEPVKGAPRHVYPFDYLWPMPWLALHPADPRAPGVLSSMARPLAETLRAHADTVLLVDRSPKQRAVSDGFDVLAPLRTDPAAGVELARYGVVETIDMCGPEKNGIRVYRCRFDVMRPMQPQGATP